MSERAFSPVISLLTVASVWDGRLGAQLRDLGLSTRKYALLAHIEATPGISFSELSRRSQITVQSAHTAVQTLVADGLVEDATKHAGSASDLRVTARGNDVLQAAQQRLAALDAALTGDAPTLATALEGLHEQPYARPASHPPADLQPD